MIDVTTYQPNSRKQALPLCNLFTAIVLYRTLKGNLMTLMLSITADCFTNFLVTTKFSQLVAVYSDQNFRKYLENKQRVFLIPQSCYMHSRGK